MPDDPNRDLLDLIPLRGEAIHEGYVKVKLAHARGFTVLLPDLLIADLGGWRWFQPQYFSAPLLSFFDDAGHAEFNIEPAPGVKLLIGITRDRLVRSYADGSFLYRCRLAGPKRLKAFAAGTCSLDANHTVWLDLFHHTSADAAAAIRASEHFRGSRWNIQGTKRLTNVEYAYFTSLPRISSRKHLERIAMATDGALRLITTNGVAPRDILSIKVYRESTLNRRNTIRLRVPADTVAPQHVWRHDANDQPTYYEASHPAIFRVGLEPGTVLPFADGAVDLARAALKRFDYAVLGFATTHAGLVAPYDEEDTRELFKIERCEEDGDLFAYWRRHHDQDLYTGRRIEQQAFEGPTA
ncbi:hypothetical protein [Azospirillum canadense]|uniref:hypothetical protein n=1 Tax=Azospirillum canadense TaxID=403962 RepID=UPI0022267797|nr:hypothetical protein [Azospirillum canadense]MCW2236827.1 preprotein translocase subunit Sec61beta [Azospirillum canadense]